jgi:hypothetical protein
MILKCPDCNNYIYSVAYKQRYGVTVTIHSFKYCPNCNKMFHIDIQLNNTEEIKKEE